MTLGVRMKTYELVEYIFAPCNEKKWDWVTRSGKRTMKSYFSKKNYELLFLVIMNSDLTLNLLIISVPFN